MLPLKPLPNFSFGIFFSFSACSSSDVLGDGFSMPTPPTKFLNMPLVEQLVQEFDIVHKSKCPSHLLEGLP